jgi:hypothetical protein
MQALLLTLMVLFTFSTQAFTKEKNKAAANLDSIHEESESSYSPFNIARILVDVPSNFDRNKGYLAVDTNGRLAVYLIFEREHNCVELSRHSRTDILAHWSPTSVEDGADSFAFYYWERGHWSHGRVEALNEGKCPLGLEPLPSQTKRITGHG